MAEMAYRRSVEMAVQLLGSDERLAEFLGTTVATVNDWVRGATEPPLDFRQRLIDLLEQQLVGAARIETASRSRRDEST